MGSECLDGLEGSEVLVGSVRRVGSLCLDSACLGSVGRDGRDGSVCRGSERLGDSAGLEGSECLDDRSGLNVGLAASFAAGISPKAGPARANVKNTEKSIFEKWE